MTRRAFGAVVLIVLLVLVSGAVTAQFPTPTPEFWEVWQPGRLDLVSSSATYVNLRDWPSTVSGKIIAQVRPGAVEVSNDQAVIGWQRIMVNGQKGWVSETAARAAAIQSAIQAEQLARDTAINGLRNDYKTTMQDLRSIVTVAFDAITQRIEGGYTKLSDAVRVQSDKVTELDKSVTAANISHDQRIADSEKRLDLVETRATTLFTDLRGVHDRVFGNQSKPDDKSLFAMVTALPDQITAGVALRLDTFEQKMRDDTDKTVTDFMSQLQADMNEVKEWMRSRRQIETVVWNAVKGVVSNKWVQRVVLGLVSGGGAIAALSAMSEVLRGVK